MNWDAISAVAEIAGAIGVIVSLLYLSIQIRAQSRESRLNTVTEAARQWNDVLASTADNSELCNVWVRGLEDFESLEVNDRAQFSAHAGRILRVVEGMYEHYRQGRLSTEAWEAMSRTVGEIFSSPGGRVWWETRAHWYTGTFQKYIEQVIAATPIQHTMYQKNESYI